MARLRELKIGAVSAQEMAYLLGLFLADGSAYIARRKGRGDNYCIKFCLQGDQLEIAERVVGRLKKLIGVAPRIVWEGGCMWAVKFESKALFQFLPNKLILLNDDTARDRFFYQNRLFEVENGVPFVAGLLDGDGSCEARVNKKECCFGAMKKWKWSFSQSKSLFLVDYVKTFVTSLAFNGNSVKVAFRPSREETRLCIRKSGIVALLNARIVSYSWKVRKWLERIAEIQSERAKYYTVGQVARMLGVSGYIVRKWIQVGKLKCLRRTSITKSSTISWRYIPTNEVETLRMRLREEEKKVKQINIDSLTPIDAARFLSVSPRIAQLRCPEGKLHATKLHEENHTHLLVPREEIKTLTSVKREVYGNA